MDDCDKSNIISVDTLSEIWNFIYSFRGLAIECELQLISKFPLIPRATLKSIVCTVNTERMKTLAQHNLQGRAEHILKRYSQTAAESTSPMLLLNIAKERCWPPSLVGRTILNEIYKEKPKEDIIEFLRYPHKIPDEVLAANVRMCILADNQNGSMADMRKRCVGEEYEFKMKKLATERGLHYFDEADLRRTGFDKTPDMKLVLPCLYKGHVVNWIESKALFGDEKTHLRYLKKQLVSYENRFGPGIVIYWFGFVESIQYMKDNGNGLIILNGFPAKEHLELFS